MEFSYFSPEARSPLDAYRGTGKFHNIIPESIKISKSNIYKITVKCPFCKNLHKHGGGEIAEKPHLGHRIADCGKGSYNIIEPGSTFAIPFIKSE